MIAQLFRPKSIGETFLGTNNRAKNKKIGRVNTTPSHKVQDKHEVKSLQKP